jgi:hypothetical protein
MRDGPFCSSMRRRFSVYVRCYSRVVVQAVSCLAVPAMSSMLSG